ncbi:hypothetical protein GGR55DRAFT_695137 [Xylaria sp. FL0064]|nr:hypothetical protein GGR55DRAFT_695137 [Xylaria sp. FL0064]
MAELARQSPDNVDHISTRNLFNRFAISSISERRPFDIGYGINCLGSGLRDNSLYPTNLFTLACAVLTFDFRTGLRFQDLSIHRDEEDSDNLEQMITVEDKLLSKLVNSLANVETFSVNFRTAGSYPMGFGPNCPKISFFNLSMDTLLLGLRSQAFESLVDLLLTPISTHDFWKLATGMPCNVKQQLKHLYIEPIQKVVSGFHPTRAEHSSVPSSNPPVRNPDKYPEDKFWEFIESCNNLESLAIQSDFWTCLDRLSWKPRPNSKGLRSVYLHRASTNISTLINLLGARHGEIEKPVVRRIQFAWVFIIEDGGDWSTLFNWLMDECPRLEFFDAHNIDYETRHENAHRLAGTSPYVRGDQKIWSSHSADISSIRTLMHKLAEKAGGESRYPANLKVLSCL